LIDWCDVTTHLGESSHEKDYPVKYIVLFKSARM